MSDELKIKIGSANKGKKVSLETRKKLSIIASNRPITWRENARKAHLGQITWQTGKKCPQISGKNHWNWQGGKTDIIQKLRNSPEYKLWREAVFERDNFTCIWCGDNKGGNLQADHIKPFCDYPELRFAIDNGRTLCKSCHLKTDTFGRKALNYKNNENKIK